MRAWTPPRTTAPCGSPARGGRPAARTPWCWTCGCRRTGRRSGRRSPR
ncbi:hypothetical protein [Ornithinimicrobium kibberense]